MAQIQSSKNGVHGENGGTFEENFRRLQEVVQRLSEGNMSLGDALGAYEEGMALADRCAGMLDEAELRVKQVSDRSMRAGIASAAEMSQAMRASQEPELVTFELDTFEALIFEDEGSGVRGRVSGVGEYTSSPGSKSNSTPKPNTPHSAIHNPQSLDPLFDEDD